jgi:hypothetical protein
MLRRISRAPSTEARSEDGLRSSSNRKRITSASPAASPLSGWHCSKHSPAPTVSIIGRHANRTERGMSSCSWLPTPTRRAVFSARRT